MNQTSFADRILRALTSPNADAALQSVLNDAQYDANQPNTSGLTPLRAAIMNGNNKQLKDVIKSGARISDKDVAFVKLRYPHKSDIAPMLDAFLASRAIDDRLRDHLDGPSMQ